MNHTGNDAMPMMTRSIELQSLKEESRSVSFIASTTAEDSYGEIVEQDWILERFHRNPVVLFSHDSKDLPIGHATRVEVIKGRLEADISFLGPEANPKAEYVFQCVKQGALRAVSVGFVPGSVRLEKRNGKEVYVLSKNVLHEISVVACPANPDAIALMRSKARASANPRASASHDEAKNMSDENENLLDTKTAEVTAARAEATELRAKLVTLEGEKTALARDRDAALLRAKEAELRLVGAELDALIGVKITPAEKANLLELAGLNRDLYERTITGIKAREPMHLLSSPIGTPPQQAPATSNGGGDNGASLAALVSASL